MAKRKGRDDSELKAKFIKFASTMRLSSYEIASIVELVKKNFADDATVYLFGSRVNDQMKGGDIDLFIHAAAGRCCLENKIRFLADLEKKIGERKVDVVFDVEKVRNQTVFYNSIQRTKQLLKP